jgi:cob(I)alamin adenosyltransferase
MVRLDAIVTRAGDGGETALGDGTRVPKTHARVEAYGAVDELNAVIGLLAAAAPRSVRPLLARVQNDLFDLGADLCVPESERPAARRALRLAAGQTAWLEREIAARLARQRPLKSFVLPGGSPAAAWAHLARTVCRRAERRVAALAARERVQPEPLRYLNRLSDLLFVLARAFNADGRRDRLWIPGAGRAQPR